VTEDEGLINMVAAPGRPSQADGAQTPGAKIPS
jgi:hypothetical protein